MIYESKHESKDDLKHKIVSYFKGSCFKNKLKRECEVMREQLLWENIAKKTIEIYKN